MKLKKHKTLREQIATSLRESIIRRELPPGQKLTEPELAAKLGISRTPIREAFRQLESEGFLAVIPRRGAVVSTITAKQVEDFYEIKSLLEGFAARVVAEKISDSDIEKLKRVNSQLAGLAEKGQLEAFFAKNNDFHNYFIKLCGNEKLLEIRDGMVQRFKGFRMATLSLPGRLMESVNQHKSIIRAFEKKDGRLAEAVVVEHALLGGEELVKMIKRMEESGIH
ncbi:MAG: GntR family transcriptional regulator [Deltaproteobacteria bacterium]|nr:GntR family transcriptional regulator [Deltaproteobacteria bacterium]